MESEFSVAGSTIVMWKQREGTVRPSEDNSSKPLQPITEDVAGDLEVENGEEGEGNEQVGGKSEMEELNEKYQQLKDKVDEYMDDENGRQCKVPPMVRPPTQPTREEFERHQTTHIPYAPWCKHCLAGRAVRHRHPAKGRKAMIVPDTEIGKGPVKVSMDYMYLHERRGKDRDIAHNPPHMIMIEHKSGRCWAYRVPNKGVLEEAHCLAARMIKDLDDAGLRHETIQLKADQEPAIITVQKEIQELRPNVVPTNSPVGESECNGRVENTIRRIQEKTRVLRHQLEQGLKEKIPDEAPIMAWMVRWAAELISKYSPGDDGITPYERIRLESCVVPLVPFGEAVMYLPLKTAQAAKGNQQRSWVSGWET